MSANELKELLALPEYRWVKEDLLPAYYVLSKMGFGLGNGYQFLPTSEENLLLNLKTKRSLSELREVEQIFANWVGREREEAVYDTGNKVYPHKHHSGNANEIRIDISGPLLNIGKEEFERRKQNLKSDFEIKTIYDLFFFFKYLLSNTNVTALGDTGFLSVVTKERRWGWREDSTAELRTKSLVRNLISCNKALLSDSVIGTIAEQLRKVELFYEFMDSIPERYKVAEHDFNSSSCYLHYKYAVPSEVWSRIRAKIEGIDYVSIIKPSLSKLEKEYGDILNEIKFLELLKQEKVDANNRMKRGDYERFSDVIEQLNMEGIIKIASTGDIILLVEGWTIVTRIDSLGSEVTEMILRWLNEKVEPELGIETVKHPVQLPPRPVTGEGKVPVKEIKDIIIGSERESEQWGIIGKSGDNNLLVDLNAPHIIFVCGKMGYGKGYIIGVLCEMLASHTIEYISRVLKKATIIVFHRPRDDVRSEFWSMVYPNDVESEIRSLKEYNASPSKLFDEKDFRVFLAPNVYENVKEKFEREYETKNVFPLSLEPSKLSAEDWGIALSTGSSGTQYIKKLFKILEELQFREFTVNELKKHILDSKLNKSQKELAIMRIELVEDFLKYGDFMENLAIGGINVVDLRKLMKTPDDIFAIMTLMLSVIQSKKGFEDEPFVFVINEAHEYFRKGISKEFVDKIEHLIRRKRHGANWLLLDTHKPNDVSSNVVEFSDVKIIHRMDTLTIKHLRDINELTKKAEKSPDILDIGEAIVVADESSEGKSIPILVRVRPRITEHGGATKTAV